MIRNQSVLSDAQLFVIIILLLNASYMYLLKENW